MKKIITLSTITTMILVASFAFAGTKSLKHKKNFLSAPSVDLFHHSTNLMAKDKGGDAFAQGKLVISAGYGWPNLGKAVVTALIGEGATNIKATGLGPLHFRAEYGLSDGVGMGVSVNYISFGVKYTDYDVATGTKPYDYAISRSSLSILARINFHFGTTEQLDPYFGIGAGYKQVTWKFTSTDPNYVEESIPGFSPFGFETTIGLRYYFTDGFGIYTEMGIAKSIVQGGLVVAF